MVLNFLQIYKFFFLLSIYFQSIDGRAVEIAHEEPSLAKEKFDRDEYNANKDNSSNNQIKRRVSPQRLLQSGELWEGGPAP